MPTCPIDNRDGKIMENTPLIFKFPVIPYDYLHVATSKMMLYVHVLACVWDFSGTSPIKCRIPVFATMNQYVHKYMYNTHVCRFQGYSNSAMFLLQTIAELKSKN